MQLRREATENGAEFFWNVTVERVWQEVTNKTETVLDIVGSDGRLIQRKDVDVVVVACGAETTKIQAMIPFVRSLGSISFVKASTGDSLSTILVDTVTKTHVLQRRNDMLVIGGGELEKGGSEMLGELSTWIEKRTLSAPSLTSVSGHKHDVKEAVRPIPRDGLPVIGFSEPREYTAAMHSAITVGPLLGDLVASELLEDVALDIFANYRPSRFMER